MTLPFKKCKECGYEQKEYCNIGYYPDVLDWCPYEKEGGK